MHLVLSISLSLGLMAGTAAAQSTVYKWVDERGVTQYTQTPPQQQRYDTVRMSASGQSAAPAAAQAPAPAAEGGSAPQAQTPADVERQEYCDAARRNLETLQSGVEVQLQGAEGEEPATLDAGQRAEQLAMAERQVTLFCRD